VSERSHPTVNRPSSLPSIKCPAPARQRLLHQAPSTFFRPSFGNFSFGLSFTSFDPVETRQVLSNKEPKLTNKEPKLTNKRPKLVNKKPKLTNKRPKVTDKEPKLINKRPKVTDKEPKLINKRPKVTNKKTKVS